VRSPAENPDRSRPSQAHSQRALWGVALGDDPSGQVLLPATDEPLA
jgi:hypothetical protein